MNEDRGVVRSRCNDDRKGDWGGEREGERKSGAIKLPKGNRTYVVVKWAYSGEGAKVREKEKKRPDQASQINEGKRAGP